MKTRNFILLALCLVVALSGCAKHKKLEQKNIEQQRTITDLNQEIAMLNQQLEVVAKSRDELLKAKEDLEKQMKAELSAGDLQIAMKERGLVITVLNRILFASGKSDLKPTSEKTLQKVAGILKKTVPNNIVYVEGHTDNVPIKYSGWKSNWELSTARATEVVHFLIKEGVNPERLVACGYGQYSPVADNATAAGQQKNRRVEIIVSPKRIQELLPKESLEGKTASS